MLKFLFSILAVHFSLLVLPIASADEPFFNLEELHNIDEALSESNEPTPQSNQISSTHPRIKNSEELKTFYDNTIREGMYKYFGPNDTDFFTSDEELMSRVRANKIIYALASNDWIYSLYPDYNVKKIGYNQKINSKIEYYDSKKKEHLFLDRKNFLLEPGAIEENLNFERIDINKFKLNEDYSNFQNNLPLKWLACLKFSPLNPRKCSQALNDIMALMKADNVYTAIPIIKEVIEDQSYVEGASRAALKIMDKVEKYSPTNNAVPGDLFTDICESYQEVGLSQKKAEEMTWKLLAVYSSRGPNIYLLKYFTYSLPSSKTLVALETIANSIPTLDALTFASGHPYSLPKMVFTTANYGKPYHFWMSGYLSREMTKKYGENAAVAATSIVETGYQMLSKTLGREDLFDDILSGGSFSAEANKTRIDLTYGYAGAHYGSICASGSLPNIKIDIDEAIKKSINLTNVIPHLSKAEIEKSLSTKFGKIKMYYRWNSVMNPKTILSNLVYKKKTNPSEVSKCNVSDLLENIFKSIEK